jgi:MFS family permease
MLLGGILLGLILGLLVGGRLSNLINVRLSWVTSLFVALILRYGTELAIERGITLADQLRLPLFASSFVLLLAALWANRRHPGLTLAFVGVLSNAIAIVVNGGRMPIWEQSLIAAGFSPADAGTAFHTVLHSTIDANFLLHAGPFADVIPIPIPIIQNVASVGDLFLTAGLAFFLFATVVRSPDELDADQAAIQTRLAGIAGSARLPRSLDSVFGDSRSIRAETGLARGFAEASALERPLVLAGAGPGLAAPALAPLPLDLEGAGVGAGTLTRPWAIPPIVERARRHPYVRLALNGSFTALWTGQLISLFGDRVHQVALATLVYGTTGSAVAVAFVFVAATLPNLLLSPIAGTFVDRWDQKEVLVVSDLLRAAAVLLVPVAASINVLLVYPLIFVVTCISIFFRPAKTAVLPRLVAPDELVTANSATWLGETLADIVGYPLAGLFVAFLANAVPLAFWFDAATYIASAILIASIAVPAVQRSTDSSDGGEGFVAELMTGWRFLRGETVLLANTLQGVAGQFTAGVALAVTFIYAHDVIRDVRFDTSASYALLETGVGLGNLVGGFVIGLIGARLAKGRLVIAGYAVYGLCTFGLALTGSLPVAIGLMIGAGVANMVYVIPSQTLFQERAPADMIGRVVGFRFALVFGSMTLAMAVGGLLTAAIGVQAVLAVFGFVTLAAGLAGLVIPAVRNA